MRGNFGVGARDVGHALADGRKHLDALERGPLGAQPDRRYIKILIKLFVAGPRFSVNFRMGGFDEVFAEKTEVPKNLRFNNPGFKNSAEEAEEEPELQGEALRKKKRLDRDLAI